MKPDVILCPVDFSEPSRHAFDYAMALARYYSARVIALHVVQPVAAMTAVLAGGGYGDEIGAGIDLGSVRERLSRELRPAPGVAVTPDVTAGTASDAIADYARVVHADLIVMGTRGTSGLKHLVLGSVAEAVLRTAPCPVLVIPPGVVAPVFPFTRVLCPTDFSTPSVAAMRAAASLTRDFVADVTLLYVIDDTDENELFLARVYDVHRHAEARESQARAMLADYARDTFGRDALPTLRVAHGKPDREILHAAAETDADLIVMGVRGRSALNAMLFGSTTNAVVRHAARPVLTTHL